jgi:hypothetical protein
MSGAGVASDTPAVTSLVLGALTWTDASKKDRQDYSGKSPHSLIDVSNRRKIDIAKP